MHFKVEKYLMPDARMKAEWAFTEKPWIIDGP